MTKIETERMLKRKGFSLNVYTLEILWEFEVEKDEELKAKLCKIFGVDVEEPEKIILQCRENFTNCIFYYDCNVIDMDAMNFIECVKQMDDVIEVYDKETIKESENAEEILEEFSSFKI